MDLSGFALLIVIFFLQITLRIGLYFSRKTTTFSDYAVGRKNFETATLVATVLATTFGGGSVIRTIEYVHEFGLYWVFFSIVGIGGIDLWMISVLAERMAPFMHHLSIAETIGSIYGRIPRMVAAASNIVSATAIFAIQIHVMSLAISIYTDLFHPKIITTLATLILITYTALGGIRSVTYTDVFQLIISIIIIPILVWFLFQKTGKSLDNILYFLQIHEKFQISHVFRWDISLLAIISLSLSNLTSAIGPLTMHRVYMASSTMQVKRVFLYACICSFVIINFILLIGIALFVDAPDLPSQGVWKYVINNISPFFKSLVCIGLLAFTMSTADSVLNTCSVMVSHDIIEPLWEKQTTIASQKLAFAQSTSIVVGICAMVLAFYCIDLLDLIRLSLDFSVPIVTAPFILAVFGFRSNAVTALTGMVTGTLAYYSLE